MKRLPISTKRRVAPVPLCGALRPVGAPDILEASACQRLNLPSPSASTIAAALACDLGPGFAGDDGGIGNKVR
jgi:hypothetical protein